MTQDKAKALLELARQEFDDLTPAEEKLFRHVAVGEDAIYMSEIDAENDPAKATEWGDERVLRATCIAWLCTDPEASKLVTHRGIRMQGVRIDGLLDLAHARIPFPLYFGKCSFLQGIDLRHAKIAALNLEGSHTGPISADRLKLDGSVRLCDGFTAEGEVRLTGATIGGALDCRNGRFLNNDGEALSADLASIKGSVFLDDGFQAEGEVRLVGATIDGSLNSRKGQFLNKDGYALSADRASIKGSVYLDEGFRAEGQVRLTGATIGGELSCKNGRFFNEGGHALFANRASIKGTVFLSDGFRAQGEVRLIGATINGDFVCETAQFLNKHGHCLTADGLKVNGSVYLRKGFRADGKVSFALAQIDGGFVWTGIDSPELATLDLQCAKIGTLCDDEKSWPQNGKLVLHGLVYEHLADEAPTDAKSRIDWLSRQGDDQFRPQPYEQLAEVLRKSGHESDAKKILIQKNKDRRKLGHLGPFETIAHVLLRYLVGFGYRPWQLLLYIVPIILLGSIVFRLGFAAQVMTPTKDNVDFMTPNSFVYSVDMFVPLVNLNHADYWQPDMRKEGTALFCWNYFAFPVNGTFLFWYLRVHIVLGWILTTLFVVGLTGVIRR